MKARRVTAPLLLLALLATTMLSASPATAGVWEDWKEYWRNWEETKEYEVVAVGVDAVIVRPLATVRVAVGAALMIPASLFTAPSGKESLMDSYELLVQEPTEYAFQREMGEF